MKILSPQEAYRMVEKIAKENGMSVSAWAEKKKISKGTISKWRSKKKGTLTIATLQKLGVEL